MIEWAAPWAFALALPVLLLPLQEGLTGTLRLDVPGPDVMQSSWTLRRLLAGLPRLLQVLGLLLLVVALARPRLVEHYTVTRSEGLDIMLAIDTSGSMSNEDFSSGMRAVTRLDVAKAVMSEFVDARPNDRIGVVAFGEEAFTHVPLTLDHDTLNAVLAQIQIGIAGEQRTAIGSAIAVAARRLKDLEAPDRIIILLTDGQSNAGRLGPIEAAELAQALGIRVYTIGVGAQGGGWYRRRDGLDEDTLKAIADRTGGRYFRATDVQSLEQIYATIDQLEPSPAEVEELADEEELFRRALIPGVGLLLLQVMLSATFLRRYP